MRPTLVGDPHLENPTPERWINTAAFAAPERFTFGNAGRSILRSDGAQSFDLSLFCEFPIPLCEGMRLQFRAEAFNAFNTPRFNAPVSNVSNSNFGAVLSTANHERQLQLGVKINLLRYRRLFLWFRGINERLTAQLDLSRLA